MYNWRQSLHLERSSMQADGIDIMQRIVASRNFANTLTNGKVIVTVFTLCDVAHRCYAIYAVHVLTISVSPNIRALWYTIYYTGLYQHLHVSAPRCHPQVVIITKVFKATCLSQIDCEMCVHVCHVVFWNVMKRFQNLVLEIYIVSCEFRLATLE